MPGQSGWIKIMSLKEVQTLSLSKIFMFPCSSSPWKFVVPFEDKGTQADCDPRRQVRPDPGGPLHVTGSW